MYCYLIVENTSHLPYYMSITEIFTTMGANSYKTLLSMVSRFIVSYVSVSFQSWWCSRRRKGEFWTTSQLINGVKWKLSSIRFTMESNLYGSPCGPFWLATYDIWYHETPDKWTHYLHGTKTKPLSLIVICFISTFIVHCLQNKMTMISFLVYW